MSLDYGFSDIENWEAKCYVADEDGKKRMDPTCESLIWACYILDLNNISDKTMGKWKQRIAMIKQSNIPALGSWYVDGKPVDWYPSHEDLEKFKGLNTNVSTSTDAQFWKKFKHWLNEAIKDEL